jgi:hypothetical protein
MRSNIEERFIAKAIYTIPLQTAPKKDSKDYYEKKVTEKRDARKMQSLTLGTRKAVGVCRITSERTKRVLGRE